MSLKGFDLNFINYIRIQSRKDWNDDIGLESQRLRGNWPVVSSTVSLSVFSFMASDEDTVSQGLYISSFLPILFSVVVTDLHKFIC